MEYYNLDAIISIGYRVKSQKGVKYTSQYHNVELIEFKNSHDRFLILDKKEVFHIGASLKDLGKKWFGFSKFEIGTLDILGRLK
jgi:hypothetical protein